MGKRKDRSLPSQESLESEGFISLEEIDPSSLVMDAKENQAANNGWIVTNRNDGKKMKLTESKKKAKHEKVPRTETVSLTAEADSSIVETSSAVEKSKSSVAKPSIAKAKSSAAKTDVANSKPKSSIANQKKGQKKKSPFAIQVAELESKPSMENWALYELNSRVLDGLQTLGFSEPTPIQEQTLAQAMGNRVDVVGAAKTGSGKTLAYGLPILHRIAQERELQLQQLADPNAFQRSQIYALILVPTRELGLQVVAHLKQVASFINKIKIVSLIGGMSIEKQQRELSINPDIAVATPGRLWELLSSKGVENLASMLASVKYFVIDEADRMVETGHFKELDKILEVLYGSPLNASNDPQPTKGEKGEKTRLKINFQTFVFSATLSLKRESAKGEVHDPMQALLERLRFRGGHRPFCIDLVGNSASVVPESLREFKIAIPKDEKDLFLVYLLSINAQFNLGQVLVFMNSIDGIRRLVPLLKNLGIPAFPLHSQMQQRQRLNHLDRFRGNPNGVLIASDVAARGLDIPKVSTVIHYQLPPQPDLYIHRSGRTARANGPGISIALVGEDDFTIFKRVLSKLDKQDLPKFPEVDLNLVYKLKPMIKAAKRVDEIEHTVGKANASNQWMQETAGMLGIEVDETLVKTVDKEPELKREASALKKGLSTQMKAFGELLEKGNINHPYLEERSS